MSSDIRSLNAEELIRWFALLGDDFKQYGALLEGTTGTQLYEATKMGNLEALIFHAEHRSRLQDEINSPNQDLIRRAKGGGGDADQSQIFYNVYKTRLTVLLTEKNPVMLRNLDNLLKKFPGKEDQVYKQMCKNFKVDPLGPPTQEEINGLGTGVASLSQSAAPRSPSDFEVGEDCYAKQIGTDRWLNARITNVSDDNSNTYDIFVYSAKALGVAQEAVNVHREYLKKKSERGLNIAQPAPQKKPSKPKFQMGDRVEAFGLRSHTTYNGLKGTVLLYVPSERRYQVRLDTHDVIAIKERNVKGEGE